METKIGSAGFQSSFPASLPSAAGTQSPPQELVRGSQVTEAPSENGKQSNKEQLEQQIDAFNKLLRANQSYVRFVLHQELNEYYVQVVNDNTKEVIREIPSKKLMDTVAKMYEMIGLLVDHRL